MAEITVIVLTWARTYRVHKESQKIGFSASFSTLVLVDGTRFVHLRTVTSCPHAPLSGTTYFLALAIVEAFSIASNIVDFVRFIFSTAVRRDDVLITTYAACSLGGFR